MEPMSYKKLKQRGGGVLTTVADKELIAGVDALAQRLDRSRGYIMRKALEAYIAQHGEGTDGGQ